MADAIILAAAIFAAGISVGIIVIVSLGIRREERESAVTGRVSLAGQAPGRISHGSRSVLGVYHSGQGAAKDPPTLPRQDLLV